MAWFIIKATTPKGKSLYYCGDGGTSVSYRKTRDPYTLVSVTRQVFHKQMFSTVFCSFMAEYWAKKSVEHLLKRQAKYGEFKGYTFEIEEADPDWTSHYCALTLEYVSAATVHTIKDYYD